MRTSTDHAPAPNWPGRLVELPGGVRVYVASTAAPGEGPEEGEGGADGRPVQVSVKEPVLCVHGMAGAATNWTDFMAELAGEFACEAVDLPGSGWSPRPATMAGYTLGGQVATVIKVIEQRAQREGCGPVHLAGNSMGGLIAVKVAASRPDLVRTLTLLSPAMPERAIRRSFAQFPLAGLPGIGMWLLRRAGAYPAEARVRGVMAEVFYAPDAVSPERVREAVAEMERRDQLGYAGECLVGAARALTMEYLRPGWSAGSAWRAARAVRCPVLAIYGSHDQLVNPKMARRAARAFPDSRVIVLPRTGHVAQMEHPARVAAEFRELAAAARDGARGAGRRGRECLPRRASWTR